MEKEQLHLCPHCGNKTILKLIEDFEIEEDYYDLDNQFLDIVYNNYYVFKCLTCNRVSLYGHFIIYLKNESIDSLECLYPIIRSLTINVPLEVRRIYKEAKRVEKISPTSFVILIRKAFELICIDQHAIGSTLSEKINNLMSRGILPGKISELGSMIRVIGNMSAHGNEYIDLIDADYIDEFFNIIVEYMYSIDSKINSLKCKWELNESMNKCG